jgi:NADPH-dependent 2,4-dienoyl-CoA reductase/sulfur reductase-like enzyme
MDSQGAAPANTADESSAPAALWRRGADLWDVKGHVERPAKRVPVVEEVYVLVAGGGITGIIAALAAGRLGVRTLVVEPFGSLGGNMGPGMFAGGSLHLALKNPEAFPDGLGGIPQEFNERVVHHEERRVGSDYLRDSKTVPYVATRMLEEAGVGILLFSSVVDVVKEEDRLTGILVENKSGTLAIRSRVAVDCTGTADVADRAGAPSSSWRRIPPWASTSASWGSTPGVGRGPGTDAPPSRRRTKPGWRGTRRRRS